GAATAVKGASKSAVADFVTFFGRSRANPTSVRRVAGLPLDSRCSPGCLLEPGDQCGPASSARVTLNALSQISANGDTPGHVAKCLFRYAGNAVSRVGWLSPSGRGERGRMAGSGVPRRGGGMWRIALTLTRLRVQSGVPAWTQN